tara:strand:+ start:55 stop:339 length:285 start_codon:yes stop_codon:yes gene_type:complete
MDETLLTTYSSIIGFMILVIGFFISRLIGDLKKVVEDTGKNKGRIDLVAKQQENDIKRIEERTTLELCNLSKNVKSLTENVNNLVSIIAQNGVK